MRIRFSWTEVEWQEVLRLARERKRRRSLPMLVYGVLAVMLLGVAVDSWHGIHGNTTIRFVPFFWATPLLPLTIAGGLLASRRLWGRIRRQRSEPERPDGELELHIGEDGLRCECWPSAAAAADRADHRREGNPGAEAQIIEPRRKAPGEAGPLRPWSDWQAARRSRLALVLLGDNCFTAIPIRALLPEQTSHVHRLLRRKLRA